MQGEDEDYERFNVMRQLLDGKERSLSEMNPEILSLCEVTPIDKEIEGSEEFTASNYTSEMQNRECEQGKQANSTLGITSKDNTASESNLGR